MKQILTIFKKRQYQKNTVASLVGITGFEPATSASRTQRSTKLSHIPKQNVSYHIFERMSSKKIFFVFFREN